MIDFIDLIKPLDRFNTLHVLNQLTFLLLSNDSLLAHLSVYIICLNIFHSPSLRQLQSVHLEIFMILDSSIKLCLI